MKINFLTALAAGFLAATGYSQAETVYVSNLGSTSITALNTTDGSTSNFSKKNNPGAMTIDSNGYVYATSNGNQVLVYATDGSFVGKIGSKAKNATGIAIDDSGNIFVSKKNGKIVEITTDGKATVVASKLSSPTALAFDSNGNLFVTSGKTGTITEIAQAGWTSTVTFTGAPLSNPSGIAIDSAGNIFVVNSKGPNGPSIEEITGGTGKVFATEGLKMPKSIAVDKSGNVFVTDSCSNSVTEYDSTGKLINTFSSGLNGPSGIVIVDDRSPCGGGPGSGPTDPPAVPEPSTYAMLLGSIGVFYFLHRRKLAKAQA